MKRITKADLKGMNIINPWDLAGCQNSPKVYVDYYPQQTGWASRSAHWSVIRVGFRTDPNATWQYGSNKTFACYTPKQDKEPRRLDALAWATERYGITEWEFSPFGSYHPKGTLAKIGVT